MEVIKIGLGIVAVILIVKAINKSLDEVKVISETKSKEVIIKSFGYPVATDSWPS